MRRTIELRRGRPILFGGAVMAVGLLLVPGPVAAQAVAPTTPSGLRAVTGGASIVVDWTPSTAERPIQAYRIYRDGARIATSTPASTPNYADREGARYTDQAIQPGGAYS